MLHMYHGSGKGKTTAGFGLALRELGYDRKVLIIQFLKNGTSGEMRALASNANVKTYANMQCAKFYYQMDEDEKVQYAQTQKALWKRFTEEYKEFDYILLDELLDVINLNILEEDDVIDVLQEVGKHVEIVMTGRNPSLALQAICAYVSEMVAHKHPYEDGVQARMGVEF